MKRPAGIVLTSAGLMVGGLYLPLLSIPLCLTSTGQLVASYSVGYVVVGLPSLITAVGLLQMRRWARYVTLALWLILAVIGLCFVIIALVAEIRAPGDDVANREIMWLGIALAACGGCEICYLSRAVMKQRFGSAASLRSQAVSAARAAPSRKRLANAFAMTAVCCLSVVVVSAMFALWEGPRHPCGVRVSRVLPLVVRR